MESLYFRKKYQESKQIFSSFCEKHIDFPLLELKAQGKTILLSSHNKEDIEILCDQVFHMERGKLARVNE
jgi:ABC-type uncharacterized transport system ATPase subunit